MGSGIILPSLLSLSTSISRPLLFGSGGQNEVQVDSSGPWTPPQYAKPALTVLSVPATTDSSTGQIASTQVDYVFDAVFRIVHNRRLRKTSHPVLTGANISDHAYIEAARVTIEIGMSDCMASFKDGIWVGASTKSISAFLILKGFQINKTLLNMSTRLDTYINMMVLDVTAIEDNKTKTALRASITLEELLSASVVSVPSASARPQTTNSTSNGVVQSNAPNASQVQQNVIPSTLYPTAPTYPNVPGAGNVSSNSLSQITP